MKKIALLSIVTFSLLNAIELNLSGSVISDNQKMITSRYMGIVKKMLVSEGDIVKERSNTICNRLKRG